LRGDSTEKLMLLLLNKILAENTSFEDIPNLTWKRGEERGYNPLTYVPANMDDFEIPGYRYTIRSVFKYRNLLDPLPYQGWLQYPNTALLTARGCTQKCLICGGSKKAYQENCNRQSLALRSPRKLVEDIQFISRFSRAPIFIIHDLRQDGQDYFDDFCQRLKCIKIKNELVFELFQEADEAFFQKINESVPHYSIEITLESHDERLRQHNGKFSCSNLKVIDTLQFALKHGCEKIDLFFMVGIPGQTYQSALKNINFCEEIHITCNQDKRLCYLVAPLAPFLDPASAAFENPEIYGYKKLCHTLEDYRQVINQPSWKQMLSYETTEMTRDDLVNATYDSARKLNDFKFKYGLIDLKAYRDLNLKIAKSKTYIKKIDEVLALPKEQQAAEFFQIQKEIADLNKYSICAKNELKWEVKKNYANPFSIAVLGIQLLYEDYCNRLRNRLNPKRREQFKIDI
jgi:B12-binding domain/radical SAM domain protein